MRILFASGKGGAGKTTVTAGIAAFWPNPAVLADADVEAPDLGLYLPHAFAEETPVGLEVPVRVTDACDLCGECTSICQFNAIKKLGGRIMPFSDMCHGCGGCTAVCAPHAIVTGERELGRIGFGALEDGRIFLEGRSRVGEAMTPPLIRALLSKASACAAREKADLLIDAPPGVSCPVMTAAGLRGRRRARHRSDAFRRTRLQARAARLRKSGQAHGRCHQPKRPAFRRRL